MAPAEHHLAVEVVDAGKLVPYHEAGLVVGPGAIRFVGVGDQHHAVRDVIDERGRVPGRDHADVREARIVG